MIGAVVLTGVASAADGDDPPVSRLQRLVTRLGEEASAFDRGATFGLAVIDLTSGQRASFQGDQWIKSASSLKPMWVAAAIRNAGVGAVAPLAPAVMSASSNEVAGSVVRVAGGLDAINEFTRSLGLDGTLVVEWTFGTNQRSREYPGPHQLQNFTDADDLAFFWAEAVWGRVAGVDTPQFLEWASAPRWGGPNSAILLRLPADVRAFYKMGVLPPGRSYEDDEEGEPVVTEGRDTVVGGGVIITPDGRAYAIGVGAFAGQEWQGKINWVAYVTCRIHAELAGADPACDRGGDPARTRLDTDAPVGGLLQVTATSERLVVEGWAWDPDDPDGPIVVGFTVDGVWSGGRRTFGSSGSPRDLWDGHTERTFRIARLALLGSGAHEVCAVAFNDGQGPDASLGCRTVVVP